MDKDHPLATLANIEFAALTNFPPTMLADDTWRVVDVDGRTEIVVDADGLRAMATLTGRPQARVDAEAWLAMVSRQPRQDHHGLALRRRCSACVGDDDRPRCRPNRLCAPGALPYFRPTSSAVGPT